MQSPCLGKTCRRAGKRIEALEHYRAHEQRPYRASIAAKIRWTSARTYWLYSLWFGGATCWAPAPTNQPTNQSNKQPTSKCECGCRERYARVVSWEVTSIQSADHMNARRWLIRCPTRDVPTPRARVWVSVNVTQRLYIGYDGLAGRTDGIIPIPGCNGKKKRTGALDTSSPFVLLLILLLCTRSRDL